MQMRSSAQHLSRGSASPRVTSLPSSSTLCREASRSQGGKLPKIWDTGWAETVPSVSSICLAGLGSKAHRLSEQTPGEENVEGEGRWVHAEEDARQENSVNRAGSLGAHCQGQVANPFNVFVPLAKPMRLGLHVKNAWRRG